MQILVTNTEQTQPDDTDETLIKLYGRDIDGNQRTVTVHGFRPYLYVPTGEVEGRIQELLQEDAIVEIDLEPEPVDESLRGKELAQVYTKYPQDVRDVREFFDDPYDADVPFTNRFRIDTGIRAWIEIPEEIAESEPVECEYDEIVPLEVGSTGANPGGSGL